MCALNTVSKDTLLASSPFTLHGVHCATNLVWVVLGTGRLTIARAIVCFFWTRFGKLNLEKIFRGKKKNIVGIRTHAHSFNGPVQVPLAYRDTAAEFCLNNSFIIQLFLAFPVS